MGIIPRPSALTDFDLAQKAARFALFGRKKCATIGPLSLWSVGLWRRLALYRFPGRGQGAGDRSRRPVCPDAFFSYTCAESQTGLEDRYGRYRSQQRQWAGQQRRLHGAGPPRRNPRTAPGTTGGREETHQRRPRPAAGSLPSGHGASGAGIHPAPCQRDADVPPRHPVRALSALPEPHLRGQLRAVFGRGAFLVRQARPAGTHLGVLPSPVRGYPFHHPRHALPYRKAPGHAQCPGRAGRQPGHGGMLLFS